MDTTLEIQPELDGNAPDNGVLHDSIVAADPLSYVSWYQREHAHRHQDAK